MVAGEMVYENGQFPCGGQRKLIPEIRDIAQRVWARIPRYDWAGRDADVVSHPSIDGIKGNPDTT